MRTALSCRRSRDALTATRLIAVMALSLFFVAGITPTSSHAQSLPQTQPPPPSLDARDLPAQTLFNQAVSIEREGKEPEKAIARYDEIMQRYGRAPTPGSRQFAARALLNKASILGERNESARDAILTYERIDRNFGNEKAPAIREVLASALVSKAETLYKLGSAEKSLAVYDQLEQQFGKDDNDFIKRLTDIAKWRATEIRVNNNMVLSSRP